LGPKNLGDAGATPIPALGWAWLTPSETRFSITCTIPYHTKCRRRRSHRLGVNRGGVKNTGDAGATLPWDEAWLTLRNTLLHRLCYRVKFGHSRSNQRV